MWMMPSFINKYMLLVIVALSGLIAAFYNGAIWQRGKCDRKLLAQKEALIQQVQIEQARANQLTAQYETEKMQREQSAQSIRKEVIRVIQKPVYQSCRIDADGMHLLNTAIYQANRTR